MALDKKPLKDVVGRMVVTKEGKRLGMFKDITFETRTGELIQLSIYSKFGYLQKKLKGLWTTFSLVEVL